MIRYGVTVLAIFAHGALSIAGVTVMPDDSLSVAALVTSTLVTLGCIAWMVTGELKNRPANPSRD